MKRRPTILGGASIIAGVSVGAGMLGLPTAGAGAWIYGAFAVIVLTMIVMTLSGWLLLEAFKDYDYRVSFHTVTKDLLGDGVNFINNLAVYFVGGILLYAYTTTLGFLLAEPFSLTPKVTSFISVVGLSSFVWWSTRAVDRVSVLLIITMILTFFFSISGLLAHIDWQVLGRLQENESYLKYTLILFPVALTSFGYHHSVASLRAYYQEERRAKYAILGGTTIAVALYLLWVLAVFGNLPRAQFAPVIASDGDVATLIAVLGSSMDSTAVKRLVEAFSLAAIISSFIGVGLGLFDYLADLFKIDNSRVGRTKSWVLTFLPPLILSLFSPFGFVSAIAYAGAAAAVWTCIIPALLVYRSRQLKKSKRIDEREVFKVKGGYFVIFLVLIFGVLTASFHLLDMVGWLPQYLG